MPGIKLNATLCTLRNIAALTIRPAAKLKPGDSLKNTLGFGDTRFALLAVWQRQDGNRLRTDGKLTRITKAQVIAAGTVRGEVALLLSSLGFTLTDAEVDALIAEAQAVLS